jgi:hypothetical protein
VDGHGADLPESSESLGGLVSAAAVRIVHEHRSAVGAESDQASGT